MALAMPRAKIQVRSGQSRFAQRARATKAASEPVTILGEHYRIFNRIRADFIEPWLNDPSNAPRSMLLYGPPGTGKTTIAANIAGHLNYRLITVTVSDFLSSGSNTLEARAKALFEVIAMQPRCVVLFDEIDSLLLHRDSKRYSSQDTAFQFMAPGMLTKLNDLRATAEVILIISTNYENRIDPAIKRPGRIDRKYLVLPPDAKARGATILRHLDEKERDEIERSPGRLQELERNSVFLGYRELQGAVEQLRRSPGKSPFTHQLAGVLHSFPRTTRLAAFGIGRQERLDSEFPAEELACLIGLAIERGSLEFLNGKRDSISSFIGELIGSNNADGWVSEAAPHMNPSVKRRVATAINETLRKTRGTAAQTSRAE